MSSESQKRAMENFKKKHNWSEYCSQARKKRIERLKEEGVLNPYDVASNGSEPKYNYVVKLKTEGRVLIPFKIRRRFDIKNGDRFMVSVDDNKIILEKMIDE